MKKREQKSRESTGYTRRGFMQFVGVSAGMVGASLLSDPLRKQLVAQPAEQLVTAESLIRVELDINGSSHTVLVEPRCSLLYVLREMIGLSGTKIGCDRGECGACTVLINDLPRYACMTLAVEAENSKITTLEGLMDGEELGPVQQAFVDNDALQCGYCTPGQIMAVEGLLRRVETPSSEEIRRGCSGNLCRCGAYQNIFAAAEQAARQKKS